MTSSPDARFEPLAWGRPAAARGREDTAAATAVAWRPRPFGDLPEPPVVAAPPDPAEEAPEAYARGVADGRRVERAALEERMEPAFAALGGLVSRFAEAAAAARRDRDRDLEALAVAMARRLLLREVNADPDVVAGLVQRALPLAPFDAPLCVRLHPADLEPIQDRLAGLLPAGRSAEVEWIGDAGIERGGFRIDAPARLVDGRTDVSLRALYDRLDDE